MKVKDMRKKAGLTAEELSKLTGIAVSTAKKYDGGFKDISKAAGITLYKLSLVLGCSISDLLEDDALNNAYQDVYDNAINELVCTEMDSGSHEDMIDDYDNEYDFYVSNVLLVSYIEYAIERFPFISQRKSKIADDVINEIRRRFEQSKKTTG